MCQFFIIASSLERRVRDIMHQAFWDGLKEKLYADPPDFTPAMNLIEEVKEVRRLSHLQLVKPLI